MKARILPLLSVLLGVALLSSSALAQWSTPPATTVETEKLYTDAIEKRAADILKALAISDAAKCTQIHDIIITQYRAMRARDDAVDSLLRIVGKDVNYPNRAVFLLGECR